MALLFEVDLVRVQQGGKRQKSDRKVRNAGANPLVRGLFAEGSGADERQYPEPGKITLLPARELIAPGRLLLTMPCDMRIYRIDLARYLCLNHPDAC